MLFCAEAVDWVTSGMFGKPWKKAEYVRTDCFRAAAASCAVPSAPSSVNAKAVLLGGVPWEEQWWAPIRMCWMNARGVRGPLCCCQRCCAQPAQQSSTSAVAYAAWRRAARAL